MNETLSWADGRKRITGLAIAISTCGVSGGRTDRIIAEALFPAGTVSPAAGTVLTAVYEEKTLRGVVTRTEKTAGNSSFILMKITAAPQGKS